MDDYSQTQNQNATAQQTPQEPPSEESGSFLSPRNLIKLLIGIFAVVFIFFILFVFILPNFNKKGEKVSLSFWGVYEEPQIFSGVISDFEKENPNILVTYEKQDIKDYMDRIKTRSVQGAGPDVFRFQNSWVLQLKDILSPIPTDIISKEEFAKSFYPVAQKDLIKDGAIYGIPLDIDVLSLFVNTKIFSDAGLTPPANWNQFIDTARGLTVKDSEGKIKTAGASFGTYNNITNASDIFSLLMAQDGVNLEDISKNKDRVSDALAFYTAFATGQGNVWDQTLDNDTLAFSKGNLAMYFGYYWDFLTIKGSNPDLAFSVVPVPQLSFPNVEIASYYPLGVSLKSKNQKEALLFLKYLARSDVQNKIYQEEAKVRTYGEPPGRADLVQNLAETPISNFVSNAKNATSSYFASSTFDNGLNFELNKLLQTTINTIASGTSPQVASEALSAGFSQTLQKYKQ